MTRWHGQLRARNPKILCSLSPLPGAHRHRAIVRQTISEGNVFSDFNHGLLERLREKERHLLREGLATKCPINWTVGNSEREGTRMVKLNSKLLLRAFNGECEAAIADVSWNNITKMEQRIRKT